MDFDYKKAAKTTIQFLAMGACLALALPVVMTALNFSPEFVAEFAAKQTVVYSATFFGTMGALHGVISGVLDNIPFLNKDKKPSDISDEIGLSISPPMIGAGKFQEANHEQDVQIDKAPERIRHVQIVHDGKIVNSRNAQLERT
jgi:hypothetical protein